MESEVNYYSKSSHTHPFIFAWFSLLGGHPEVHRREDFDPCPEDPAYQFWFQACTRGLYVIGKGNGSHFICWIYWRDFLIRFPAWNWARSSQIWSLSGKMLSLLKLRSGPWNCSSIVLILSVACTHLKIWAFKLAQSADLLSTWQIEANYIWNAVRSRQYENIFWLVRRGNSTAPEHNSLKILLTLINKMSKKRGSLWNVVWNFLWKRSMDARALMTMNRRQTNSAWASWISTLRRFMCLSRTLQRSWV